jgi:molybdopterin-containing oxidoreductase family iron-sulfur binding subunit
MQWATYDAVSDENRLAGLRQAVGRDVDLMLRFDQAAVILCLDADPLLTDPETIRHARGFADGRRAGTTGGTMNRLYAVEGVYSLTGAMADHRLRLESRQIAAFVAGARGAASGAPGASSQADVSGVDQRWIEAVAKDLLANRGKGLIIAGERQPAGVHAAVSALNAHLGNAGKTVSYYETKDAALPSVSSLTTPRVRDAGRHSPDRWSSWAGILSTTRQPTSTLRRQWAKVPHTIALGHHGRRHIGGRRVAHSPRALLESWGDARAVGGTLSVVQPLIPAVVRRKVSGRSAGDHGRGQGSPGLRHRARHLENDPRRGRIRQEMEPRPARRAACRQRAPRSRSRRQRGGPCAAGGRDRICEWFGDRVRALAVASRRAGSRTTRGCRSFPIR